MRLKFLLLVVLPGSVIAGTLAAGYFLWPTESPLRIAQREPRNDQRGTRTAIKPDDLPFESLETRIPKGKPLPAARPFSVAMTERLDRIEEDVDQQYRFRGDRLKALHERTETYFVESPGFGSDRGVRISDDVILFDTWATREAPTQPGPAADFPLSPGESLPTVEPDKSDYSTHRAAALGFVNPGGFGYIRDRDHVAGFRSHGFRWLPAGELPSGIPQKWRIEHIQLVGILMHGQPIVYLSDKLPSMALLRAGKMRSLDYFEEAGLTAVRGGEDLYIIRKDDTLRMFGALRATCQCLKCHDAERGDLLGAFSYTLRLTTAPSMP